MRLIMFSSDSAQINVSIDQAAAPLLGAKSRIAYIPSCSHGCEPYYKMFQDYFRRFGCKRFSFLPADKPVQERAIKEALAGDAIYLSGGNTYYFLKHLKKTGLLGKVRDYAKNGGLLLGASAGSILMTPSINTAGLPSYDCDSNDVRLKATSSMGLVPFEFSPHATFTSRYIKEMLNYTRKSKRLLYACKDGGGIVLDDSKMVLVGPMKVFSQGLIVGEL